MAAAMSSCSCGCSPCICGSPSAFGCVADFCPPRPSFFSGQLVTADDLNAVMTYFRTREAMMAKLLAGWGVLGGMRLVDAGTNSIHLTALLTAGDVVGPGDPAAAAVFPNPQIVPGSIIRVTPGASIDAGGQPLPLCASRTLDISALSQGLGVAQVSKSCGEWFGTNNCAILLNSVLQGVDLGPITGAEFWVIAERVDTPARPLPKFVGGEACDGAPSCDFSRSLEDVRIRLVADVPALYFLNGCLDPVDIPVINQFGSLGFLTSQSTLHPDQLAVFFDIVRQVAQSTTTAGAGGAFQTLHQQFECPGFSFFPQVYDFLNQIAVSTCCTKPAVVLGRVVLITNLQPELRAALGPDAPSYVFIDDAYPYRRVVPNGAMSLTEALLPLGNATCTTGGT